MDSFLTREQHDKNLHDVFAILSEEQLCDLYQITIDKYQKKCIDYFENNQNSLMLPEIERLKDLINNIKNRLKHFNLFTDIVEITI